MISLALSIGRWLITSPVGRAFGLIGAALAAVLAVFLKGRSHGRDIERRRQAEATIRAHQTRSKTDEDIGRLGTDARRERLRQYTRD